MARIAPTLFDLATEHDGVFTSAEAADAGVSAHALVMAARRGVIAPLSRGIYRLVAFPADEERVQLWEAVLWPTLRRGAEAPLGVLSHLTALQLHDVGLEYTPSRVSITVHPQLRIRRTMPAWLDVHWADLLDKEVTSVGGLPVTALDRALGDCIDARVVDRRLLECVVDEATKRGALSDGSAEIFRARLR